MGTRNEIPAKAGAGSEMRLTETTVGSETDPEEKVENQQAKGPRAPKATMARRNLVGLSRTPGEIYIFMIKPPTDQLIFSLISEETIFLLLLLRLLGLLRLFFLLLFRATPAPHALSAKTRFFAIISIPLKIWRRCGKRRMQTVVPPWLKLRN